MPFTFTVTPQSFTLEELGLAYRKAKVDLYYSSNASLLAIANYEEKLADNLQDLLGKLNGDDEAWVEDAAFLGGWTLAPKSIQLKRQEKTSGGVVFSSPAARWQDRCEHEFVGDDQSPVAEFRLMAQCSLDFHVLSALWLFKVGFQFDKNLSKSAYGNRLREGLGAQSLTLGSFNQYSKSYSDWINGGIKAMRAALEEKKKVVSLTADVSNFYHELNPGFMLDGEFRQRLSLSLCPQDEKLHRLFIKALQAWAQKTPLKKGLPVGLPASSVVANMALIELDRLMEQQVAPLYYGRYVDDILLVMENGAGFKSKEELFNWLIARSKDTQPSLHYKLGWVSNSKLQELRYQPPYLIDCRIQFSNDKNRLFLLEGGTGQALVDVIAGQIHERGSEWRALPVLPKSSCAVANDLIAATNNDGEKSESLFKTNALSLSRSGFAIMLRNFEAFERDLPPADWQEQRHAFLDTFCQQVLVLPKFFDLEKYLPRVVQLATACEDFKHLQQIIIGLEKLYATVEQSCTLRIKGLAEDVQ